MKRSRLFLNSKYFQFLEYEGQEIGFCFGVPDYGLFLKPHSDVSNVIKILKKKNSISRGRIIYSGILPEFRGQKLFKYVRYKVLDEMYKNGIRVVESSYVDQDNVNSQKNVMSVGGKPIREYNLYQN